MLRFRAGFFRAFFKLFPYAFPLIYVMIGAIDSPEYLVGGHVDFE
jgi:hypothetical protein